MKRKRFGISESLSQGFSETISMAENGEGIFRNVRMPISKLMRDPENPRKILLTMEEIRARKIKKTANHELKQNQLSTIEELASSIEKSGLINPISIYKDVDQYKIIAGERRYLATCLLGKTEIDARLFLNKPSMFELKLIQWFENTNREDLTLFEKLENVRNILQSKEGSSYPNTVTGVMIQKTIGMSESQSALYANILKGPEDVYDAINKGRIKNLKLAELLTKCKNIKIRTKAIELFQDGVSLKKAKEILSNLESIGKKANDQKRGAKTGKKKTRVKLGETKNPIVVETLINAVIALPQFTQYEEEFSDIEWSSYDRSTEAFSRLLSLLETEL